MHLVVDGQHGNRHLEGDCVHVEGANTRYSHVHKLFGAGGVLVAGTNFHDNQINVSLYPRGGRVPLGVTTRALAHVTNGAGFAQDTLSLWRGRLLLSFGLRYDEFATACATW